MQLILKLIAIVVLLSSCIKTNSQPKIQNKIVTEKSLIAIETTQGNNVAYIHTGKDSEVFCASKGSDFAFTQSASLSLSAKEGKTGVGIGEDSSAGVAELGGINSGVLLTREIMYRTCEFMANLKAINGLTPEIAQELFQTALDAVLKVSNDYKGSTETGQGSESVSSSAPAEN
jgi:hypothetical protein